jgi:hypothetical protein
MSTLYMRNRLICLTSFLALCVILSANFVSAQEAKKKSAPAKKPAKLTYDEHVKPIFRAKCFSCHNPDKKSGGLDLTTYGALRQGGASGEEIEVGDPGASFLYLVVSHESEPAMPPNSDRLPEDQLATISNWITGGALEGDSSKVAKPTFDFGLQSAPEGKPATPPLPGTLSLEPLVRTARTTAVSALATSPWAPLAAVAGQNQVLLYRTDTFALTGVLPFPEGVPEVLRFSRNGSLLLAAGGRGAAKGIAVVWDVKTGQRVAQVGDELDTILAADISADQTKVALGGPGKVVRVYSIATGAQIYQIRKHTDWIYGARFSPDGVLLVTTDRNGGMFVWEAETGREYLALKGHSKGIHGLSWRLDSNILASASEDGSVRLWEMENGRQVRTWAAHGGGTADVEFTRDGRILTGGRDRTTKLWDQAGKQLRAFEAFADLTVKVSFCDETNRAIAGDWTGLIRVWNSTDGVRLAELNANPLKLAERLTAATQQLPTAKAKSDQLAAAYQVTAAAAAKAKADLATATKAQATGTAQMTVAATAIATGKANVTKYTTEHAAAAKNEATLAPVPPLLQEALVKTQAAAAKSPTDKTLAALVAELKKQTDAKVAALAVAKKATVDKIAALAKSTADVATATKTLATATAAVVAAKKQVAAITPTIKPADVKAAAANKLADDAAKAYASVTAEVASLKVAIETEKKIATLKTKRLELAKLVGDAQAAAAESARTKAQLTAAQQATAAAQQQAVAANTAVTQSTATVTQATAAQAAAKTNVAGLEVLLPLVKETADKAQAAVVKAPGDKELAVATASFKAILAKKTLALDAGKKDVIAKDAALKAATAQLTAVKTKSATANATVVASQKTVADLTAATKPIDAKSAAAAAAAAAAKKVVDQLNAELNPPAVKTASIAT